MRKRAVILNTAIAFGFFIVIIRLVDIMLLNHERFYEKAKTQHSKKEDVQVRRGTVYDRQGREMIVNLELEALTCDPSEIALPEKSAYELSRATGRSEKAVLAKLSTDSRFVWLERKLEPEVARKIKEMKISGLSFQPDAKRYYPRGRLASHVLGIVDSDNKGIEGIELKYDSQIRASGGGKVVFERDASGRKLSSGVDMESKGNNVFLTIDEGLQYFVETELDNAMSKWRASAATAIMMDPYTGDVLALANRPAHNPNALSGNMDERRNRAITDCYEPGSTFKIIVGTAALEEKVVTTAARFDCSRGSVQVGGKEIHDLHKHGVLTFKEVIQKSSNVGSVMLGMKLGKTKVYEYAKAFGFGEKTAIDLPGEVSGSIKPPSKWSGMSIGSISIGQEVAVTPLQVLRAYSAIANGGLLVNPHVVSRIASPEGKDVWAYKPAAKRVISENTANIFKDILKTVTEEGGTAQAASVNGNLVAGKTGTAQLFDRRTKRYSKDKFISSFVGFVPADSPKIAMIVVVYEPKGANYGGVVAAPVFKKISENALAYMNVPREDNRELLVVAK